MKEMEFTEEVFKFLKSSNLKTTAYVAPKDSQIKYLAKRLRQAEFYVSLDDKERAFLEKSVRNIINQFCKDEEIYAFSLNDLYLYLLKMFYGKKE